MKKLPITVIILTYNEEIHLTRCLENIKDWVEEIVVVDSGSIDKTQEIAKRLGARVVTHPFKCQADQLNWALDNIEIKTEWILRLDADEYILPELWKEIVEILPKTSSDINGYYMKRRMHFMGRWIKHGGYYPTWILRLFRKGKGRCDDREMDEHLIVTGKTDKLKHDFVDENLKGLNEWTARHNNYSTREANAQDVDKLDRKQMGSERWVRKSIYIKLPLFFRSFLYFVWRYIFRLGFLDGKEGLIFHFLQGFWYRFLVDAKLYEQKLK